MTGSYPGLVPHHVFSDEGQELPLLAGRATSQWHSGWLPFRADGCQPVKGGTDGLGGGFKRELDFDRGFRHEDLVLDDDIELLARIVQQSPRLGDSLAELMTLIWRLWVCAQGVLVVHAGDGA